MNARRFQFTVDHMVGRREIELRVTYRMAPGIPGTGPSYACGGTPAEGPEIEIVSVTHGGKPFALRQNEEDALLEQAIERSADDWADDVAAELEWRADQRRDDLLMERWERENDRD